MIHLIFIVVFFNASAFLMGHLLAISLRPQNLPPMIPPSPQSSSIAAELNALRAQDLFKAKGTAINMAVFCRENPQSKKCQKSPKKILPCIESKDKSALPITLLGTVVLQDEVKSVASVQVRGKRNPVNLRKGEDIPALAKIMGIQENRIVIKNGRTGACEFVEAPAKIPPQIGTY